MSISANTLWNEVLARVRTANSDIVRAWFSDLQAGKLEGGVLEVRTLNKAQSLYLTRECCQAFATAAQKVTGRLISLVFCVDDTVQHHESSSSRTGDETNGGVTGLDDTFTFDRFVADPGNKFAKAAAVAVAENPGDSYNPLLIFGPAGTGKTHLLQAACRAAREHNPQIRSHYTNCGRLVARVIEALDDGALHRMHGDYSQLDLLAVDDVQLLAGRDRSQEEFFHIFETLHRAKRQVLLATDLPPAEIPDLEERLASRFGAGLVVGLDPPGLEARMAILLANAKAQSIELSPDVARLIAERFPHSGHDLAAALARVNALSCAQEVTIDLKLAERALAGPGSSDTDVPRILKAASRHLDVKTADLLGDTRSRKVVQARELCLLLARRLTTLSLDEIGRQFGGRDRSTVLNACRRVYARAENDPELAGLLDEMASEAKNAAC